MPRTAPMMLGVAMAVVVAGCARAEVPEGFQASLPPPPTTIAAPTLVPTPSPTAPGTASETFVVPSPTPSPTPTATSSTPDPAAVDEAVAFVDGLQERADTLASYALSGGSDLPGAEVLLQARVQGDQDPPRLDATIAPPGMPPTRIIIVNERVYVQRDDLAGPDTYIVGDRDDPRVAPFAQQADQTARPVDLSTLRDSAVAVEVLGEEEGADGSVVVRHRLTIDPRVAAEATDRDDARVAYESVPGDEFDYEVLVDRDGVLRGLDYAYEGTRLSFTFDAWGQDQDIRAPGAASVVEAPTDLASPPPVEPDGGG